MLRVRANYFRPILQQLMEYVDPDLMLQLLVGYVDSLSSKAMGRAQLVRHRCDLDSAHQKLPYTFQISIYRAE